MKLRFCILALLTFIGGHLIGQNNFYYYQFGPFISFYSLENQSPRVSALGGCANTITDDQTTFQINPAAIEKSKELNAFCYSVPPINSINSTYSGFKHCNLGFSLTARNNRINPIIDKAEKLTLSYSINLDSGFCIGFNANVIRSNSSSFAKQTCWGGTFDVGILYSHNFSSKPGKNNSFAFGFSFDNPAQLSVFHPFENTSSVHTDHAQIPTFIGSGISWKYSPAKFVLKNSLKVFTSSWHVGFDQHINYDRETNYRSGLELTLLEIISARCGIVHDHRIDMYQNNVTYNYFSWGIGVNLPLQKLINFPLKITFDYFDKPIFFQTFMASYLFYSPFYEMTNTIAIGLHYYPGQKKKSADH
jgi:hypothetical protein